MADIALTLCMTSGHAKQLAEKAGLSVRDWCAIGKNLNEFFHGEEQLDFGTYPRAVLQTFRELGAPHLGWWKLRPRLVNRCPTWGAYRAALRNRKRFHY